MANPRNLKSLAGTSSTGAGDHIRLNGHYHITLMVVAPNLDTANDTLEVAIEGSADAVHWTNLGEATTHKQVTTSDFTEDPDNAGVYTASVTATGAYHEFMRARVTSLTDSANGDLSVDAWVMAAGNPGAGTRGQPDAPMG